MLIILLLVQKHSGNLQEGADQGYQVLVRNDCWEEQAENFAAWVCDRRTNRSCDCFSPLDEYVAIRKYDVLPHLGGRISGDDLSEYAPVLSSSVPVHLDIGDVAFARPHVPPVG